MTTHTNPTSIPSGPCRDCANDRPDVLCHPCAYGERDMFTPMHSEPTSEDYYESDEVQSWLNAPMGDQPKAPTSEAVEAEYQRNAVRILTDNCRMMRSMEAEWDNGQPDGPERMMVVATESVLAALTAAEERARKAEDAVDDYCCDYCEGRPADEQRAKCSFCPLYDIAARDAVEEGR